MSQFWGSLHGSAGDAIFVSPAPVGHNNFFGSDQKLLRGPFVEFARRVGDTSGRFAVAQAMAIAFPDWKDWVNRVLSEFDKPPKDFRFGPYPTDKLIHKSKSVVEYETPAGAKSLGSDSWLSPDDRPIRGVAILVGETPDLWQLSVRFPANDAALTSALIQQVEREAAAAQLK